MPTGASSLGFRSLGDYARERLGWVRLARLGPVGSAVASAFRAGVLSSKQASLVSEAVPPAPQPAATSSSSPLPREAANVFRLALAAVALCLQAGGQPNASSADALLWLVDHGIHARTVACTGRAPEGLVFELGVRTSGPALLRARTGDVLL